MYNKPHTVVGLIGPINGGKSAVTNSLAKDLVSEMGLFQTTVIPEITGEQLPSALESQHSSDDTYKFNEHKIKTDDQDSITLIELPGVFCGDACNDIPFDRAIYTNAIDTYLQHMDMVYWVTDIKTAFITAHELNEFNAIKQRLSKTSTKLVIMLSKYEYDDPANANNNTNTNTNANDDDTVSCNTSVSVFDTSISLAEDIAIDNRYKQLIAMDDLKDHIFVKFNPLGKLKNTSTINTEFRLPYRPVDIVKAKQDKLADTIIELLNSIPVCGKTDIIKQIDLLKDTDVIERIFKRMTEKSSDNTDMDHLCLMYFAYSKNRVFANIGDDLQYDGMSESAYMRMALLLGLDTISGLRMYYSYSFTGEYIDQIGYEGTDASKITLNIPPHVKFYRYIETIPNIEQERLNLLKQYIKYDEIPSSYRTFCRKSVINAIEKLTEDLWGAKNDRDVRMIIAYRLEYPTISMFLTLDC